MSRARRTNGPVIDIHCHRECAPAADFMKEAQLTSGKVALGHGNATTRLVNKLQLATIKPRMDILDVRIADMDKMGVDVQVRRPAPAFGYGATACHRCRDTGVALHGAGAGNAWDRDRHPRGGGRDLLPTSGPALG